MKNRKVPKFFIKNNMQKSNITGVYFENIISRDDLSVICYDLTGQRDFLYEFVDNEYEDEFLSKSYNKGRLGILRYFDKVFYISFSDISNKGRNSALQSVPTAFNLFFTNKYKNKELYFYFLPNSINNTTNYHIFMYRLMASIGFSFLNIPDKLKGYIKPFSSIDDLILSRKENSNKNSGNNATYIVKNGNNSYDIYGKTYGANKYDTSLICYAICSIAQKHDSITLFEYNEQDLSELPESSLNVLRIMGNINIINIDDELELRELRKNNSIRSPRFNARLLDRFGEKKCILCCCEISEIIQGAHLWPVSEIKNRKDLSLEQKVYYATDGENGLWMCQNHHKLFDSNIIIISENGKINYKDNIERNYKDFLDNITTNFELPSFIVTHKFQEYIKLRNELITQNL
ncbi:HNH endonuclease signature motif containing protein [Exercitatus varius]|uniref:HNH endonuclease signature motif containing protein n=1 Tax=Exercitatus varius TaxID=67857 RepID=UPI00294ACA02|nr:HNH endonuclease signature motif containing protein [Exercitatus varius]MDG2962182.1 HNH endonuclease signature motif containing protein [Exercitatus varius]